MDVEKLGVKDFDIVLYAGVYYHVKDPLLSFTKLRRVMKEGASIIVEGAVIDSEESYARFHYREPYRNDYSNWWMPTVGCLRQWVECSFLETEHEFGMWDAGGKNIRFTMTAKAVRRTDPYYIRPEAELAEYDLNTYPRKFDDPLIPSSENAPKPLAVRLGRRVLQHYPMSVLAGPNTRLRRRLKHWAERMGSR